MKLSERIGYRLCMEARPGHRMQFIKDRVTLAGIRGCARQTAIDKVQLYIIEAELPDQAAAYYARQKPYIPSAIDEQMADIRQGWRDDYKAVTGKELIPAGYARVSQKSGDDADGQIRKIHCNCNSPSISKRGPRGTQWEYFAFGETGNDEDYCQKCGFYQWYYINEEGPFVQR